MPPAHPPHTDHEVSIPARIWERVLAVMERLAASRDLDEVLRLVVDSMRDCLQADRASVLQYDAATHELYATQAHGVDGSLRFNADLGIAGDAVRTRAIINVPDCYADARFNRDIDRRTGYRTRCMLTVPLVSFDGQLEGVAQVLNKRGDSGGGCGDGFTCLDETIARALASQAAVAIRRSRLLEAERRKDKIEADLRVAREMQLATLPARIPVVRGFDIAACNRQAEETGGDTFDVVALGPASATHGSESCSDRPCSGGAAVLMADATGHGIGPALSVTQVQSMLRMAARLGSRLEEGVSHLNELMCEALPVGRFVTAFIGVLEGDGQDGPGSGAIRYISAGQAPLVLVRKERGKVEVRDATTLPLGVEPWSKPPAAAMFEMAPGDVFLLLSDGYYEYTAADGRRFGVERAVAATRRAMLETDGSAQAIVAAIDAAMEEFGAAAGGGSAPAGDDQTAIVVVRE